jgi:enoyl-CoA hydratase
LSTSRSDLLVIVERVRPHVSVITLNKPDRLNSMSFPLVEDLYAALGEVGGDNETWVFAL